MSKMITEVYEVFKEVDASNEKIGESNKRKPAEIDKILPSTILYGDPKKVTSH